MKGKESFGAEIVLTIGGLATSLAAAFANFWVTKTAGIDVSSWMYWFVLPGGAGIVGAVAASGYYFTSLWTRRPATPLVGVNMVLIGLSPYALIQYLSYHALTFADGTPVAEVVSFWTYYQVKIEHTSLQMLRGGASTGELRSWGYVYEALRVVGFLLGGAVVFLYLRDKPYCDSCKRYFGRRKMLLDTPSPPEVDAFAQRLWVDVSDLAARYQTVIGSKSHKGFKAWMTACGTSDHKELRFGVLRGDNEDVFAIYRFRGQSPFRDEEKGAQAQAQPPASLHVPAAAPPASPSGPVTFRCWSCKSDITVPEEQRGKQVKCPACRVKQAAPQF